MSFDIALSGIQAINNQLDTISHNIANAGTYGFKSSRANFSSLYAGSTPTGTEVSSLTQSIGQNGGTVATGRGLDASINGRGFFISKDAQGQSTYSRVGIFAKDIDGFLVNSNGQRVQGYSQKPPSIDMSPLGDLPIPSGQIAPVASGKLTFQSNLSKDWVAPANATFDPAEFTSYNMLKSSVMYDSVGNQHILTQYFVYTGAGTIDVNYSLDGDLTLVPKATLTFNAASGQLDPPTQALQPLIITLPNGANLGATPKVAGDPYVLTLDYTGMTNYAGEPTTAINNADGYAAGTYVGVELGEKGNLVAKYTNGQKQSVGVVAVATFADEGALTNISDTSWIANAASGRALDDIPGKGMGGALNTARLEQSNVDITSELVGLMTSQRNYQANSKVIQTESTMLQSLMQAL
ncbi:flagellar hook protein FlgE [Rugamonas sp. DEMB1]|uniref:flagellar hook protein FlgE n=1 Tax=Rugamonas sp. DEMB1 TaxID=3039386 RepID=UPI0024493F1A|nr:flagellar hook-basal body complex protein [Rugamonas sp. DEMB1]WGG48377.1 flagellar hook-basal body complex protein [Rugamonas sp. DEMB1]